MPISEPREWFERELPAMVEADPKKVEGFNGTLLFTIKGERGGSWTVDIHNLKLDVKAKASDKADIKITIKDGDFVDFINRTLPAQTAFMSGKLKVKGDIQLAMKLQGLLT